MAKTKKTTAAKTTTAKKATKAKATKAKVTKAKATKKKTGEVVELNEMGLRKSKDRRTKKAPAEAVAAAPAVERRKTKRRRQIDPTTCERDYSEMEIEFMHAMDEYKRASGRMFPTCSEILEVLINMGYRKVADAQAVYDPNAEAKTSGEVEALESDLVESEF